MLTFHILNVYFIILNSMYTFNVSMIIDACLCITKLVRYMARWKFWMILTVAGRTLVSYT